MKVVMYNSCLVKGIISFLQVRLILNELILSKYHWLKLILPSTYQDILPTLMSSSIVLKLTQVKLYIVTGLIFHHLNFISLKQLLY